MLPAIARPGRTFVGPNCFGCPPFSRCVKKLLLAPLLLLPVLTFAQKKPKPKPKLKTTAVAPAAPYFQQDVKYSIDVTLDDRRHQLRGREELAYTNNSPEPLTFIWFHLWPNAYRDNHTAFAAEQRRHNNLKFEFAKQAERGSIDSLNFVVNGQPAKLEYDPINPDIAKLVLPQPLAPGATATIATPFRVQVPGSFSRLGHVGQSYQISQWYPKPAVLDRRGWHPIPYLSQGEFYSEFGSFDVTITLPSNYTVGATGELQNPDEKARLAQLALADVTKKTKEDFGKDMTFPPSDASTKTLRYVQDRVHDFAWFADKRFHVLQSSVTLPSGRNVQSMVLFTNKEPQKWVKGLQDVNDALTYYSKWVGDYPYASATAVDGALVAGGGMEYPMVTVTMPGAIVHEVGHNWFYGILGSNERDFPWMDEGVNTYTETRVSELDTLKSSGMASILKSPKMSARLGIDKLPPAALAQVPYQMLASRGLDQPVQGPTSADYTSLNYGFVVYQKTASLFKYLAGYLGQEKFDQAMRLYYQRWQFKHPYPEDMQAVFEESTGQKLGWFFKDMLTNTQHYDADVFAIATFPDVVKVLATTSSTTPWSVPVSSVDAKGNILETQWTAPFGNVEEDPEEEVTSQVDFRVQRDKIAALVVDAGYLTPQLNRRNDRLRLENGLFDRSEPLGLRPLASVERWDKATINWLPVLGANTSDKFMLGAAFYNSPLVPKQLQYLAMPMYSFSRNELNGIANLQLNVLPRRRARQLTAGILAQRFERYLKLEPSLRFDLPHRVGYGPYHQVKLAISSIDQQDTDQTRNIVSLEYGVRGGNARHPWTAHAELNRLLADDTQSNEDAAILLRAEATGQHFYAPKKRIQLRAFGGGFLQSRPTTFAIGMSGSFDYRYQTAFLDRQRISNTFTQFNHQTDNRDGGFRSFVPVASTKWLAALNLQVDVPRLPLAVFADLGYSPSTSIIGAIDPDASSQRVFYDAGLTVPLLRNFLEFYIPVAGTQFGGLPDSRQQFTDNIRFVLNLSEYSPFRQLDKQLTR